MCSRPECNNPDAFVSSLFVFASLPEALAASLCTFVIYLYALVSDLWAAVTLLYVPVAYPRALASFPRALVLYPGALVKVFLFSFILLLVNYQLFWKLCIEIHLSLYY
jgi:hypothetical protein